MPILSHKRLFISGLALAGFALLAGCGEKKVVDEQMPDEEVDGDVWGIPGANSLGGLPGSVYTSQVSSPIHWQPWTKASLEMADHSRRLILAVIAMPQQPSFVDILNSLSADASALELINSTYVPVLIDGDAIREMGILSGELCAEIGSGLQLPLMVWMTPEGNPIAWMPLPGMERGSAAELFAQSHNMVARTWEDDPEYIMTNSRLDQANRKERILERLKSVEISEETAADAQRALRQLTSLYDPLSRTFDEAGGLFPVGVLDVLSMSCRLPGLPEEQRDRSLKVLDSLLDDILVSPMFDPLEGGVFNSRRGSSWSFPIYSQDCSSQARVIVSLLNAYEATGEKRALDRAMGVIEFVTKNYMAEGGLFKFGSNSAGDEGKWLWMYEDVRDMLSPEELPVWMLASGMKESGNLPSELDPLRKHFRGNSIAFAKSSEEVAKVLNIDPAKAKELLESAQAKLRKVRGERMEQPSIDQEPHAVATFRMISAYATAYRITGEVAYRDLASETLVKAKEYFGEGPRLRIYPGDGADSLLAARAFVYGVAIQAALDVESVTLKREWLLWAGDLSSTVYEEFFTETFVKESPREADFTGLPITDPVMLFDESTLGLLSMSESRLQALGIPLVPALGKTLGTFPMAAIHSPILHSDLIQAALMRSFSYTYVFDKDSPDSLKEALAKSPFKGVNRRIALPSDPPHLIPKPGEAIRIAPDGAVSQVKSVADVRVPSLP
ncbi:MAG: hypothetical protein RLZZ505_1032 [Verrucomicrobiota bacterium]|jgi:uncharacterized protein YyaL (SSP411 family)